MKQGHCHLIPFLFSTRKVSSKQYKSSKYLLNEIIYLTTLDLQTTCRKNN